MASSTKRCWKLQDFVAHGASVNCLALGHKSGRVLVTGGDDKKVNLWAVGKHNCFMSLSGHTTPVECVQFGHTDELVCAGSQSGALKIWDLEAAKIVRTLTGHKSSIRCIDFHPYGDFLASGSQDTSIKLWDIRRKGCIFTYKGHKMMVNSLKFSPDGQWVASGGEEGSIKLWDLRAGRLLKEFAQHCGSVSAVKFHPNEFLLASSSADRTVNFWDLEKFQLISTSDRDVGPIRCISFSENGECLFAGSQESLKVYGWEPTRTFDTVPISWGKIQDIAIAQNQLIGASFHLTNVILHVIDLSKVQPFVGLSKSDSAPFIHGHSFRKSFSRDRPTNGSKTRLDVKTIEEAERSGTDPEDDSQSLADIKIVGDYQSIFKPHRSLNRTPPPEPFPAPLEDANSMSLPDPFPVPLIEDPMVPQILHPSSNESQLYQSSPNLNNFDIAEMPKIQELSAEPSKLIDQPQTTLLRPVAPNPSSNKLSYQRLNSCKDPSDFPELDFPVKLNNIRHSPSEPMLNRPNSSHSRSHSLNRNFVPVNNNSNSSKVESALNAEKNNSPASSAYKSPPPVSSKHNVLKRDDSADMLDEEPQKEVTFVPCKPNRSSGLNLDDFLPKSHSTPVGFQKTYPNLSEEDTIRCLMQGHRPMVTVLDNRYKCLQIILALWKNKDLKTALESALDMKDQGIVVDLLSFLVYRQKSWNLDVCGLVLPAIYELLQSRFEWYMTVGCNTLRFILVNFASVIRSNILAPVHSVGVDISREERYKKCLHCYQNLMTIRAFLLKRQTMQGKLGQMFRELHNLMQNLD